MLKELYNQVFGHPLGSIELYQTKTSRWRWRLKDTEDNTLINPIKSFKTGGEARADFQRTLKILKSL